jgi:hypothetical protein
MDSLNPPQDNDPAQDSAPTLSERLALVHSLQRQALAQSDPLAANLRMIEGDLMGIAHRVADQMQRQLPEGAISEETRRRFVHDMELYLKVVRQADRLAQLERQRGSASGDKPSAE